MSTQETVSVGSTIFSAKRNIYISRLCYNVSVHLSVCLSVWLWRKCIGAL